MPDMATLVASISTLLIAVAALVVSVGVFYLIVRIGRSVEMLVNSNPNRENQSDDNQRGGGGG